MGRYSTARSFLSTTPNGNIPSELETLRAILGKVRENLGSHARAILSQAANVKEGDIDNFLGQKNDIPSNATNIPRAKQPSNIFQKRMLSFLCSDDPLAKRITANESGEGWRALQSKFVQSAKIPDDDNLFCHLESIGAVTEESCQRLCRVLAGNYDVYRLTSERSGFGRLHISHLEIRAFDVYNKVPSFVNRITLDRGKERNVTGSVIELGNSYFFFGYVRRDGENIRAKKGAYHGSKVMVLREIKTISPTTLMGFFYTSGSEQVYDVGATRVVKTGGKFRHDYHRSYPLDMTNDKALDDSFKALGIGFSVKDISLEFVDRDRKDNVIFSSLDFDMISPRRGKRGRTITV